MAQLGAPPKFANITLKPGMYEAVVASIEEVPQSPEYYNPDEDPISKAFQYKWQYKIAQHGDQKNSEGEMVDIFGLNVGAFSTSTIGRHAKNKLVKWLRVIDPLFDIDTGYADEEELKARIYGKPVRLIIENSDPKMKDGVINIYNKVTGVMESENPAPDTAELDKLMAGIGATPVTTSIPKGGF